MKGLLLVVACWLRLTSAYVTPRVGFRPRPDRVGATTTTCCWATRDDDPANDSARRRAFLVLLVPIVPPFPSFAVMMSNDSPEAKVFTAGQPLGIDFAKERFQLARESLNYLLEHYDEIAAGGGDNVRRYLGTVGTTSGLYGIPKVLKELQDEAADVVEYTENMSDFDYYLRAADTAVYSANFVEYSAAKTRPEKFFADAKADAERMKVYMDNMAAELNLK